MGFWSRVWGGIKRTASVVWNGIKTGYRTVKRWAGKATSWVSDKVKDFGNWTRRQFNKTWTGRQMVKAWDFTVGGGYKAAVEKFKKNVTHFLGKSAFGRGLLNIYDGCKSVVNKVMCQYDEVKKWCKSRLENMGFVGELLSDIISVGTD
eukprot:219033_1